MSLTIRNGTYFVVFGVETLVNHAISSFSEGVDSLEARPLGSHLLLPLLVLGVGEKRGVSLSEERHIGGVG